MHLCSAWHKRKWYKGLKQPWFPTVCTATYHIVFQKPQFIKFLLNATAYGCQHTHIRNPLTHLLMRISYLRKRYQIDMQLQSIVGIALLFKYCTYNCPTHPPPNLCSLSLSFSRCHLSFLNTFTVFDCLDYCLFLPIRTARKYGVSENATHCWLSETPG